MFFKVAKGILKSGEEFVGEVMSASSTISSMVGSYQAGDDIKSEDVDKLIKSGFSISDIASFYGVASNVIKEVKS